LETVQPRCACYRSVPARQHQSKLATAIHNFQVYLHKQAVSTDGEFNSPSDAELFNLMREIKRTSNGQSIGGGDNVATQAD
jgi:hypothetical protein